MKKIVPAQLAIPEPQILRDAHGREVVKFTTSSGVTGWVATSISDAALAAFARSLKRRMWRKRTT